MANIRNLNLDQNLTPLRLAALGQLETEFSFIILFEIDPDNGHRLVQGVIECRAADVIIWFNRMRKSWKADGLSVEFNEVR